MMRVNATKNYNQNKFYPRNKTKDLSHVCTHQIKTKN